MLEEKLKIDKISKGTVIDHIDAGYALTILSLTGIDESKNLMTIGVNVSSKKYQTKDIIKIENVFLNETQMQQISMLLAVLFMHYLLVSHHFQAQLMTFAKVI